VSVAAPPYFPLFTDLTGRACLVVGGGRIAEGRTRLLAAHGAALRLVTPELSDGLAEMVARGQVAELRRRPYAAEDLDGIFLALAATNRRQVNAEIADQAHARGILCNVADDPDACDVHIPALVQRGDLTLAISTKGASPAVTAGVRRRLEDLFGPEWGDLLTLLGDLREDTKRRYPEPAQRATAVRGLLDDGRVLGLLRAGATEEAYRYARTALDLEGAG
jgi:precorrin-2 dehydrogenase / sirohydrochlorin ferrochelatase